MRETQAEIDKLQALLDRSIGGAGRHLAGIITPGRRLSARQVVTALQGMKVLVLATVTAAGEPHDYITAERPEYAEHDAYFTEYFGSSPTTWGPSIVFIRVKPTWTAAYASNPAEFPEA